MSDLYLVDDHAMMRDGLRAVLEGAGHRVVGEADQPTQALADIVRLVPTVLLLDLHLSHRSGFELLEQLQRRKLSTRTILLTMSAQPRHVAEAMRLGAFGYVLKGSPSRDVLDAVAAVSEGRKYLGLGVAELAVRGLTSVAIGEQLHLSPKTVESYRSRLMAKLGVSDLPALVRLAIREGLISAEDD
jgi:two-component system, NarL family, invasion response regulator UvrY